MNARHEQLIHTILVVVLSLTTTSAAWGRSCGNGDCSSGENCYNCPEDCGMCPEAGPVDASSKVDITEASDLAAPDLAARDFVNLPDSNQPPVDLRHAGNADAAPSSGSKDSGCQVAAGPSTFPWGVGLLLLILLGRRSWPHP